MASKTRGARPADGGVRRAWTRMLVVVGCLAALQRVAYVAEVHGNPYWRVPLVDAADYHTRAMQVMHGAGLGHEVYYKAPAYAWFVGQIYRITGPRVEAIYILQMLGGVLTALLAAALAARAFGMPAGWVAGLCTGLYGPLPYYENQLLIEPAALAVSMGAAYLVCRGPGLARLGRRAGAACDLGAGALAGLALQLRPVNVALVVALAGVVLLAPEARRLRFARLARLLVPILLALVPTARHNRIASGRLVPVSVNGGINFYIGNNPDYDTTVAIRPGLRWEELTQRFGSMNDPVQWQQNFYHAAFDWMRREPAAACRLGLRKLVLFWNRAEIDRNQDSGAMRGDSRVLGWSGIPWALLGPLGLAGLVLTARAWRRTPVHVMALLQMAGVVAFFVTSRYRIAVVPWIAIAAGAAVAEVAARFRAHDTRRLVAALAAVALAAGLVWPGWFNAQADDFGRPDFDRAEVLARTGDREGALQAYAKEVQRHPDDPDVRLRYGEQLERMHQPDAALTEYRRATDLAPWSYKPPLAAGTALFAAGDWAGAWDAFAEADRRGDPHGRSLYDMGLVRERQKRAAEALGLFQRAMDKPDTAPERVARLLGIGRTALVVQRVEEARAAFARAAAESPDPDKVRLDEADALLRADRPADALTVLDAAPNAEPVRRLGLRARTLTALGRTAEAQAVAAQAAAASRARQAQRPAAAVDAQGTNAAPPGAIPDTAHAPP